MASGDRVDPFRNFNFRVEIDGITQAGFAECSGFGSSNDPLEYREGDGPHDGAQAARARRSTRTSSSSGG